MKLRIAVISDWFSENMGYAENFLPKALAAVGHDVHLVTSTAQVYYTSRNYSQVYEPFLGPGIVAPGVKAVDGFTLHRLPLVPNHLGGTPGIRGLYECLAELRPDIVQTFEIPLSSTFEAARYCKDSGCRLFLESHMHASVFHGSGPLFSRGRARGLFNRVRSQLLCRRLKFVNSVATGCYAIARDVARIAVSHFGIAESKMRVQSLGVDTNLFHPAPAGFASERAALQRRLGVEPGSVVCIYTGRFTPEKNPACLAHAVRLLRAGGAPVTGLFVGNGSAEQTQPLRSVPGCIVHDFVPVAELPRFYWSADIGVWPAQESTSQLDAMACGLPLVLGDRIEVTERVQDNGFLYFEGDAGDLAARISALLDPGVRQSMASAGIRKAQDEFSWLSIARSRTADYERALPALAS